VGGPDAGVGLVDGVDDEDGVVIGDGLDLLEGDNAVVVDSGEAGVGFREAEQAGGGGGDREQAQGEDEEVEFCFEAEAAA
jgi:hypothetical protein